MKKFGTHGSALFVEQTETSIRITLIYQAVGDPLRNVSDGCLVRASVFCHCTALDAWGRGVAVRATQSCSLSLGTERTVSGIGRET